MATEPYPDPRDRWANSEYDGEYIDFAPIMTRQEIIDMEEDFQTHSRRSTLDGPSELEILLSHDPAEDDYRDREDIDTDYDVNYPCMFEPLPNPYSHAEGKRWVTSTYEPPPSPDPEEDLTLYAELALREPGKPLILPEPTKISVGTLPQLDFETRRSMSSQLRKDEK